jgi:hypothetical protein
MMSFKYYLADALRDHSPGAVATALEKKGCYGYDRFGRLVHLKNDLIEPVLKIVADFYQEITEWIMDDANFIPELFSVTDSPSEVLIKNGPWHRHVFWHYGWLTKEDIPVFTDSTPIRKIALSEKPLGPRERDNLYELIIAMAIDGYGYDVNAPKSIIPAELERVVRERLNIEYSSETISNHLRAARELVPLNID